jgi:hypothetical protein
MLTESHKASYNLVKHQASQHSMSYGKEEQIQAQLALRTAKPQLLMTVTTLQRLWLAHQGKYKSQLREGEVGLLLGSGCVICDPS